MAGTPIPKLPPSPPPPPPPREHRPHQRLCYHAFRSSADFIFIIIIFFFSNTHFRERSEIRMSYSFDPDQTQHIVGSDLGPNCLKILSASDRESPIGLVLIVVRDTKEMLMGNLRGAE